MANSLMFEVGVSESVKNLDKLKKELDEFIQHYTKGTAIKLKIDIENLQAVTTALSQLGDSTALRNLRNEIAALNREFSILSKGAGGSGDIASRGIAADIERTSQSIDRYTSKIKQLTEERSRLVGGTRNSSYQNYTDEILRYEESLEGARKKLAALNEQKNQPVVGDSLKKSAQDAQAFETAISRIETAIGGLKSGMNVNLSGDFAKWAQEVQNVTASVRELVEQFKQLQQIQAKTGGDTAIKSQTEEYKKEEEVLNSLVQKLEFYKRARERAEKTISELNSQYPNGFAQPWKDPAVHAAIQQDRELQEKTVASLDSKWDAFWKKHETQAVQFAQMLGKSLDGVTFDDFYKHANGKFQDLAKSWYATFHSQGYDKTFLFDPDHEMKLLERLKELRKLKNEYKDSATFQRVDPNSAAELQVLESLKRKIDEYQNARNKAFSADPNQTAAMEKLYAAEAKYGEASTIVAAAKEKEAQFTKEVAQQQQKLNELQSKGASTQITQGGIFDPQQFKGLQEAIDAVIREINRLKEAFAGVGEIRGLSQLTESMNALFHNVSTFKDVFATLSAAVNLTPTSEYVKKLQTDFEAAQAKVQELTEKLTALAAAQNNVAETASKAGKSEKQIGDSQAALFNRYQKAYAEIQNIKREIVEIQRSAGGGGPFGDKLGEYFSALNRIRNVVREIATAKDVPDAIAKGMSSELLARISAALANVKTQFKDAVSEAKAFNKSTDKGSSQAEARIRKLGMAFNELKNYMRQNGGSEEMKRLQNEIQGAIRKMRDLMNAGRYGDAINVYERLSGIIRQAATATKEFERAQQGVSGTVSHTNGHLQNQSQILSDLKSMAMQYLSVWGAQSFINNIIELGGQLEQQRLSIGAILQDTAQANHLFGQIKDLAIRSPFGVQQLDAMTKQLSAYGFQYSELYEWTKRLADISAATGTSVDRLALALGHVRSEGALSGYTLRQFSMGNIPLLQKLSENLGKTKQEIRKMTRNKEIGYEDVLNVLKQLTDESGMFYQAQETMSQALNAKFKNLRDSFQIMYSEMAEGAPGDFLKGVAEVLTDISKSWRILMPLIMSGGATLGIWKLSTMALNRELERTGRALTGNAMATSKYSVAQLRTIATTGRLTLALKGLGRAMMSIGKFIFNPVTLGFAAVEGLIYLWSKHNDEVRRAKDLTKAYGEEAVESEKNIAKQLEKIKPFSNGLDDSALKTGIDSMTESIKNYAINGQSIINSMFGKDSEGKVMSLAEKYQYLRDELEETAKMYKELKRVKDAFEYGITESDYGWFDDNVETNLTKYAEAYKKFVDTVTSYNAKYGNSIEKAIKNAQNSDLAFGEATKNMKSYGDMLAEFWSAPDKYKNAAMFMNDLFGSGAGSNDALNLNESFFGYLNNRKSAMEELDQFMRNTEERLKEKGYDFSKELAPEQVGALLKMSKDWLDKHSEWENIYDTIKEKLEKRWPIKIVPDASPIEEELPEWLQEIQDELDQEKTGIQIKANMSMEQIIEEARKAYKAAETTINMLGPIAIKAGIKVEGLTDDIINQYGPASENYNPELYNSLLDLKKALDKKGLTDSFGKKRGIDLKGMRKDGTHKAEKQNQEAAKAVREQVRVIKEAADAFQYWRDKVGDKGAWEHVQSEFGDVLNKIGITADNIEDVRGQLKKIPQMKEYKAITDQKVKTEIDKEIAKENDQFIRKDFERDTERFLSKTQIELDNLTRSWETFNSVREATGNIELAVQLGGAGYASGRTQNLADAIKEKIQKDFASVGAIPIPFDINLSDEQIGDAIKAAMPKASEEQIKGVVEEYKKWRDLQRDVEQKDRETFSSLIGSAVDLQSELRKISDEYLKIIQSLDRMKAKGLISGNQYNQAKAIADANLQMKTVQAQNEYKFLMDGVVTLSKKAAQSIKNDYVNALQKQLKAGAITAKDYADKIQEINAKMKQLEDVPSYFRSYTQGGFQGLFENMMNRGKSLTEQGAAMFQQGAKEMQSIKIGDKTYQMSNLSKMMQGNQMSQMGADMMQGAQGAMSAMSTIDTIIHGINDAVQSMKGIFDEVREMFDALGHDVESDSWQDANTFFSSFSKASQNATEGWDSLKNGNIGGAIQGTVGSITSWITGFAQGHDAKREKHIQDLKREVERIGNTLDLIKSIREDTLGYDKGNLRREMTEYYNSQQAFKDVNTIFGRETMNLNASATAMKEYYSRGGIEGNGYKQELEALKKQREDYQKMWEEEDDKKKSSAEALEEYKAKMSELDLSIRNFSKTIAEELFGIDLKGWADQIGDALMTAFENGEDAAEAFNDTVQDIMRQVLRRMLNLGIIEPMMERLQKRLFGENGQGGVFDPTNPEGTIDAAMRDIAEFFGEGGDGQKMIEASETFYKRWQSFMESQGLTLESGESSSSTVGGGIKSITEQTADLLAGYINSIRADVSENRNMIAQYFPMFYQTITSSNASLTNIENHTAAIMRSNDDIKQTVNEVYGLFNGLKNKAWKMPMA